MRISVLRGCRNTRPESRLVCCGAQNTPNIRNLVLQARPWAKNSTIIEYFVVRSGAWAAEYYNYRVFHSPGRPQATKHNNYREYHSPGRPPGDQTLQLSRMSYSGAVPGRPDTTIIENIVVRRGSWATKRYDYRELRGCLEAVCKQNISYTHMRPSSLPQHVAPRPAGDRTL